MIMARFYPLNHDLFANCCWKHIGIFSRYAIEQGVNHIISYEPESSNFDLLLKNLSPAVSSAEISIELHPKAVGVECAERTLVRARNENDGRCNVHPFCEC